MKKTMAASLAKMDSSEDAHLMIIDELCGWLKIK